MKSAAEFLAEARNLHQQGNLPAAEAAYQSALALAPDDPDAVHFLGVLARQTGRAALGLELIQRSITLAPHRAQFHYHLGKALDEDCRLVDAAAAYRQSAALAPGAALPLTNLGLLLQSQGKLDEAIEILHRVVELEPRSPEARFNLARAYEAASRGMDAVAQLGQAVSLAPESATFLRLAAALRRLGQVSQAIETARQITTNDPDFIDGWLELARAYERADRKDDALAALRRGLQIDPNHAEAAFHVQTLSGNTPAAPPAGIIRDLYDGFADNFDHHLQEKLHYAAPQAIADMLNAFLQRPHAGIAPPLAIFDAGCGTGLAAPLLAPLARQLVGADLSPNMIRQAQTRGLYHELLTGDIVQLLRQRPASFDLILALEVLIHLGDLQPVFQAAAAALTPRGIFALSTEALEGDAAEARFRILPSQRYAHSLSYLRALAAQHHFDECDFRSLTLRQERGVAVGGYLLLLQRRT